MRRLMHLLVSVVALSLSPLACAEAPIVYPAKGQSAAQQKMDDGECYVWAKQNTGIDPAALQAQGAPEQPQGGSEAAKGAARGAAGGAAIGSLGGEAGKGAAAGAIVGTIAGSRKERSKQAESAQESQSQQKQKLDTYYRAYGACMKGRGYTVD